MNKRLHLFFGGALSFFILIFAPFVCIFVCVFCVIVFLFCILSLVIAVGEVSNAWLPIFGLMVTWTYGHVWFGFWNGNSCVIADNATFFSSKRDMCLISVLAVTVGFACNQIGRKCWSIRATDSLIACLHTDHIYMPPSLPESTDWNLIKMISKLLPELELVLSRVWLIVAQKIRM